MSFTGLGRKARAILIASLALGVFWWALRGAKFEFSAFATSVPYMLDFLTRTLPPDASVARTSFGAIVETLQMTLLGTSFGALIALPLAFAAARNLSPRWLTIASRITLSFIRTVPSILWALFFAASVGLGPMAGVLALTLYSIGMLGKLYYDSLEAIEAGPIETIVGTGAVTLLVYRYGVIPQFLPHLASHTVYGYEYNLRHAAVLGLVGAGGIGFYLLLYVRTFQYDKIATAFLMLLGVVVLVDWLSGIIRRRIV